MKPLKIVIDVKERAGVGGKPPLVEIVARCQIPDGRTLIYQEETSDARTSFGVEYSIGRVAEIMAVSLSAKGFLR